MHTRGKKMDNGISKQKPLPSSGYFKLMMMKVTETEGNRNYVKIMCSIVTIHYSLLYLKILEKPQYVRNA